MTFSHLSLAGFLIALGLGLVCVGVFQKALYPRLRYAHEKAKLTQTQGRDPIFYRTLLKFIALLVLPVLGFYYGHALLTRVFG